MGDTFSRQACRSTRTPASDPDYTSIVFMLLDKRGRPNSNLRNAQLCYLRVCRRIGVKRPGGETRCGIGCVLHTAISCSVEYVHTVGSSTVPSLQKSNVQSRPTHIIHDTKPKSEIARRRTQYLSIFVGIPGVPKTTPLKTNTKQKDQYLRVKEGAMHQTCKLVITHFE